MTYKAVEALRWGALAEVVPDTTAEDRRQAKHDELMANAALLFPEQGRPSTAMHGEPTVIDPPSSNGKEGI